MIFRIPRRNNELSQPAGIYGVCGWIGVALLAVLLLALWDAPFAADPPSKPLPVPRPYPAPPPMPPDSAAQAEIARQQEISRASRMARQAESDNDWERALVLWRFMDEKKPGDFSAYMGIKRSLVSLSRFDEALKFLDKSQRTMTGGRSGLDPATLGADRVEVLFAAGRDSAAESEMERLIAANKGYPNLYRALANVLYSKRQSDEAIKLLLRGRCESGEPYLFAREIAQFAEARMDWETAVSEYLLYLSESPGRVSYVTGALGDIMSEPGGDTLVVKSLERLPLKGDEKLEEAFLELKAGLMMRSRRFAEAITAYRRLDELRGGDGEIMLDLASRLSDEGEPALALEAYSGIISAAVNPDLRFRALIGRAQVYERLGRLDSARASYEAILRPGTRLNLVVEADYRLGLITLREGGPVEEARNLFEAAVKIIKQTPQAAGSLAEPVLIQLAITWEMSADLDRAQKELERIVRASGARANPASEARLELARLAFRRGAPDVARKEAQALLAADAASPAANQALELLALLDALGDSHEALRILGQADLLFLLGRQNEGERLLDSLAAARANPRTREEALWAAWRQAEEKGSPDFALRRLEAILALDPPAIKRDRALLEAGRSLAVKGNIKRAVEYYNALLEGYPDSPLADEARRLARLIQQDNL